MITKPRSFSTRSPFRPLAAALAIASLPLLVGGCGLAGSGGASDSTSIAAAHNTVSGQVYGGQQPISNGVIQMWSVGTGGNGTASTNLMNGGVTVTTNTNGYFVVTGKYTCPTANPAALTYMTASTGNPGLANGTNNTKIMMLAALGACNTLTTNFPFININEVTTAASVAALAPFMKDSADIASSSTNTAGIANAFVTANNLAYIATGSAPGISLPSTSTAPVTQINTIADIISACVNTDGTSTPMCSNLLSYATVGSYAPVDTATAVLSMIRNPLNQVNKLYSLIPATPPFQSYYTTQPPDWTVAIKSTGAGLTAPTGIAIDASGNAWVANSGGTSITEFSATGTALSGSGGYTVTGLLGPQALAIDSTGNVWIANSYGANVIKMTVTGGVPSGTSYTAGGIASPSAIALDTSNNVYVTNYNGASLSIITSNGTAVGTSPFTANGTLAQPDGVAIDAAGNVWVTSSGSGLVAELNSSGTPLSGTGYTDGALLAPAGVAIDGLGNAYVASTGINAVSIFGSGGSPATASPVSTAIAMPAGIVTDAANTAWITDSQTAGGLSMLASPTGTPIALGSLNTPTGVAVDASGSVWTANAGDNSITQFVGLATTTKTPLASHFTAP